MSKFPEPLPLDRQIIKNRLLRRKEILVTARRGVILRGILIVLEAFGFFLGGSTALLLDAISSSVDILASLVLIWCVHAADLPPDDDHPYGHGRFEPIAGLLIGCLLIFLGVIMGYEQIKNTITGEILTYPVEPYVWTIPLIGVILLESSYQILKRTAKKRHSPALMADSVHYRIDALTTFFALFSLVLAAFFPAKAHFFDRLGAILISLFMILIGFLAARKNIHQLLDRRPPKEYFEKVRQAAMSVKGIEGTEKLRIQVYGPDAQVAIDVEVDPELSVASAHRLSQKVRRAIQLNWPAVRDVIVHIEPFYPGDHEP